VFRRRHPRTYHLSCLLLPAASSRPVEQSPSVFLPCNATWPSNVSVLHERRSRVYTREKPRKPANFHHARHFSSDFKRPPGSFAENEGRERSFAVFEDLPEPRTVRELPPSFPHTHTHTHTHTHGHTDSRHALCYKLAEMGNTGMIDR